MNVIDRKTELSSDDKKTLRRRIREMMADFTSAELHERSLRACAQLTETREYKKARVVMVFLSLPAEIDTTPVVLHAWREMKRVLAPKVGFEQRRMLPIEISSLSDNLSESTFGVREPVKGTPMPIADIDMVIVPGLGFDTHGNRIGRGRGFYDRFLANPDFHGVACALATEEQVVDQVPTSNHDRPVDMLVTDSEVRRFKK